MCDSLRAVEHPQSRCSGVRYDIPRRQEGGSFAPLDMVVPAAAMATVAADGELQAKREAVAAAKGKPPSLCVQIAASAAHPPTSVALLRCRAAKAHTKSSNKGSNNSVFGFFFTKVYINYNDIS